MVIYPELMYPYILNRLYIALVQWVRLIFNFMEINIDQVNTSDITVPCSTIIQLHRLEVCCCSELRSAWQALRYLSAHMLASDRDIEVVQNVEGLSHCFKTSIQYRSSCLEERCSDKT